MKKQILLFSSLLLMCMHESFSQNLVSQHGLLTTSGSKIIDKNGTPFSIAGNSLFWTNWAPSFCNADLVNWLKKDWKTGLVRIAMGIEPAGAYLDNPAAEKAKVFAVVDACIAAGVYVLIDWHDHTANTHTAQSIAFFQEMATKYGTYPNVMYELFNEPLAINWTNDIKPYATQVIAAIRAIDPDNLIIVGTPNWSQDVDAAADNRITGYSNIAYTLHFYIPMHGQWLRDKATYALNKGLPLFVTEWGFWENPLNIGEFNAWRDFMKTNNLSNANWSVNTKNEVSSILKAGASSKGGWTDNQLTEAGKIVREMVINWYGTPVACDVFDVTTKIESEKYCAMFGVQVEPCTDAAGGQDVGYIDANDWMTYSCNASAAGSYTFSIRVASMTGGGKINIKSGETLLGTLDISATNGWQNWTTLTKDITLPEGEQDLTIEASSGGFNVNWMQFSPKILTAIEVQNNNAITYAPNPFQNNIQFSGIAAGSTITVSNTLGQILISQRSNDSQINFGEQLHPGYYLVQISNGENTKCYKIIKD